ncbi:OLC1v1016678C1 [Oldenlandia corymbosa var. corymbosa]|uniref:OLC1v1016678C1 n=1 Tax=Oldenlandia corymbosa var. corymbosa TaxID=529605 RepID=A0AAV1E7N5_OLDCO|nr:OLC1v1016678C1 [Oldenlandia corymbosa var. corymbosa]
MLNTGINERLHHNLTSQTPANPTNTLHSFNRNIVLFDGVINSNDFLSVVEVVIWNTQTGFKGCFAKTYSGLFSPLVIESLAAWEGIVLALSKGINHLTLAGDSSLVIHRLEVDDSDLSDPDLILSDVKSRFENFLDFSCCWVNCRLNVFSHSLAQNAKSKRGFEKYWESIPVFVVAASLVVNLLMFLQVRSKVEEEHVVGFDEAAEEVEKLLTGAPECLEIVSIVGMLGLGKTTLARKLFKDPDVDYEKQYLVVLDDIWEKEDWDNSKGVFPNYEKRCRVLITTRNDTVAEYANPHVEPYRQKFLELHESRELLAWRVYGKKSCPKELEEHEVEIAEKCVGPPLAIVVIEGLLQQEGNENFEDMAELYLDELIHRNLVMVGRKRSNDKIKTCRMHDTLRKFCKSIAAEENLFHKIKKDKSPFSLAKAFLDPRRLCPNNVNVIKYMNENPSDSIPYFHSIPVDLNYLILLKYQAISSNFSILPSSMSDLWCLQTLIVQMTSPNLDIKADIWKMLQFRNLHSNASSSFPCPKFLEKKSKEDALAGENIQTLSTISPEICTKDLFDRTSNLKKLGIRGDLTKVVKANGDSSLFEELCKRKYLENMKLLNDNASKKLYSLPLYKSFPRHLSKLTLTKTFLPWKEMCTLGKLEKLVVSRKEHTFKGNCWNTEKGGFPCLKNLYIGHMELVAWGEASAEHFPVLWSLVLYNCDKLTDLPHGLEDISSFQSIVPHCILRWLSARKLELAKIKKKDNRNNSFKLCIYPPDH